MVKHTFLTSEIIFWIGTYGRGVEIKLLFILKSAIILTTKYRKWPIRPVMHCAI